jgi:hypothetical protein
MFHKLLRRPYHKSEKHEVDVRVKRISSQALAVKM